MKEHQPQAVLFLFTGVVTSWYIFIMFSSGFRKIKKIQISLMVFFFLYGYHLRKNIIFIVDLVRRF